MLFKFLLFCLPGMMVHFLVSYPVFCNNLLLTGVQQFIFFSYTQFYSHFDKIFSFFRVWWLILPSHTRFCSIIFLLPGYSDSVLSLIPILLTKMYISAPALVLSSAQYLCNFLIRSIHRNFMTSRCNLPVIAILHQIAVKCFRIFYKSCLI